MIGSFGGPSVIAGEVRRVTEGSHSSTPPVCRAFVLPKCFQEGIQRLTWFLFEFPSCDSLSPSERTDLIHSEWLLPHS